MARPIFGVGGRKGWSCVFLLRGDYKVLQILNTSPRVNKKPRHDRQQNYILVTYRKMEKCIDINFWNFNLAMIRSLSYGCTCVYSVYGSIGNRNVKLWKYGKMKITVCKNVRL